MRFEDHATISPHAHRVVVGMSGGVDSSVSALLLKQQGYDVVGVFMKNWEETDEEGNCTSDQDFADVRRVCDQIDIPYYTVNFTQEYQQRVFSYFLEEHKRGRTPNPDILCNTEIKFKAFLDFAKKIGARWIAMGHFAQTGIDEQGKVTLIKGVDPNKEQTYFLHGLTQEQLSGALFPVGSMTKRQVRELARQHNLSTADKRDSTGICFIGERNFRNFLMRYLPTTPGDICSPEGIVVGSHDGLMYYTIGQRKGLRIGGEGAAWFVVGKDLAGNRLIVQQGEDAPLLYADGLTATDPNWIAGVPPAQTFDCMAKFRYRQPDQAVRINVTGQGLDVEFMNQQRAITPGQYVVLYQGERCLGGAVIDRAIRDDLK